MSDLLTNFKGCKAKRQSLDCLARTACQRPFHQFWQPDWLEEWIILSDLAFLSSVFPGKAMIASTTPGDGISWNFKLQLCGLPSNSLYNVLPCHPTSQESCLSCNQASFLLLSTSGILMLIIYSFGIVIFFYWDVAALHKLQTLGR